MIGPCENTTSRKTGRARGYIEDYRPQPKTLELIKAIERVLHEYADYWPLTIRQIFYRLVGAYRYPKTEAFYRGKLCYHLANARRGGMIPFDAIRDDGVSTFRLDHFDDEEHFNRHVRELGQNYTRNKLANQPLHIEVWCEAAGMVPQLYDVAEPFSVRVYSCGRFDSLTLKKELAGRICDIGKPAVILHLGDYDPSGESIFTSIAEDVSAFVEADRPWATVTVAFRRLALTATQVEKHDLSTAPAKETDSRSKSWVGETCQLEAMPPDIIAETLANELVRLLDPDQFQHDQEVEEIERRRISLALPAPGAT
jgi:hypothetical protein